jgi:hypothetical protein
MAILSSLVFTTAFADAPVYKDSEGPGATRGPLRHSPEVIVDLDRPCCAGAAHGYQRPVNGGPGYVGSVRGLGRPSFDGLWPPPGYGSYRELPTD